MIITGAGLFLNLTLNIILLPELGVIAAVYSTIITEYFILILEAIYIYSFISKD